jgi:rubrerythrin
MRMGFTDWALARIRDGVSEVYECRSCGTTLASREESCPYCGPTDVVRFELPA